MTGFVLSALHSSAERKPVNNEQDKTIAFEDTASVLHHLDTTSNFADFEAFLLKFPGMGTHPKYLSARKRFFFDYNRVLASGMDIDSLIQKNPCYMSVYYVIDYRKGERFQSDFLLNPNHQVHPDFRGRFVMAEFNTVTGDSSNKGVHEIYPDSYHLSEFRQLRNFADSLKLSLDSLTGITETMLAKLSTGRTDALLLLYQFQLLQNYQDQVNKYRSEPIVKEYNYLWKYQYNTGQHLCMCDVKADSIELVGRFATSGKAWTKPYNRHLPVGSSRNYYGAIYSAGSRCWEYGRKYTDFDAQRDALMGGGTTHVVIYEGNISLPNFITLVPDSTYKDAMWQNGIHTQALPYLLGGMLGTPNSMGCWRVTSFASKFIRWWLPSTARILVYYNDENYFKVTTLDEVPEKQVQ
jgi:hypothetical protein